MSNLLRKEQFHRDFSGFLAVILISWLLTFFHCYVNFQVADICSD